MNAVQNRKRLAYKVERDRDTDRQREWEENDPRRFITAIRFSRLWKYLYGKLNLKLLARSEANKLSYMCEH